MQINVDALFKKYGITEGSVNRAVIDISEKIDRSPNPVVMANMISADFGGDSSFHPTEARIIAKSLVVEALQTKEEYDAVVAMEAARKRVEKMRIDMPWSFKMGDDAEQESHQPSASNRGKNADGVDIKSRAFEIWSKHRDTQKTSDIARVIAGELDITYANAYYYISRVFNKMAKKLDQ